jgi:cytoskeletal protein CcmA (bactofilin family)
MSTLRPSFLALACFLAFPAAAQETLELDESALPPGITISVELGDEIAPAQERATPVEPDTVEARLARLEANLERQQALLERVVERLEPDAAGTTAALPAVAPLPSIEASFEDAKDISSFGAPVEVAVGETVNDAVAFGFPVRVEGTVQGDAVSFGSDLVIASTGVVHGDAVSFGGRVEIEEGGIVHGDRVALASDEAPAGAVGLASLAEVGSSWMHGMVRRTVLLLCLAGIGVLLLGLFPDKVRNTARGLERHPIRYGLAGLLLSGTGLAVAGLLGITIIGLPISAFVLLLLGLAWLLGFVALGQALGDLLPVPPSLRGKVGAFLIGVCLLGALSFVPYLGKLLIFFSFFPCVGAAVGTRFGASQA